MQVQVILKSGMFMPSAVCIKKDQYMVLVVPELRDRVVLKFDSVAELAIAYSTLVMKKELNLIVNDHYTLCNEFETQSLLYSE